MVALATIIIQVPESTPANAVEIVDTVFIDGDILEPQPYVPTELFEVPRASTLAAGDPLNLVLYPEELLRYSLGTDVFEVWECPDAGPLSMTASQFVADAEANVSPYFAWLSSGRYYPTFIVGGVVPSASSWEECSDHATANATGSASGALFLRNTKGGFAGPGVTCTKDPSACPTTYPENSREGFIGINAVVWTTLSHEMGHMLSWPHSSTKVSNSNDYDNAIDLMSGNYGIWSSGFGTYPEPYATIGINRYGAGWVDTGDVIIWDGTDTVVTVGVAAGTGNQLVVVDEGTKYYTFDLRISQTPDPFPTAWTGVEVYEVERCSSCWGLNAQVTPTPPVPFDYTDTDAYSQPLPHVLVEGGSISLSSATVTFVQRDGATATLHIAPTTRFLDVPETHTFYADIEWLASAGITKGCNPAEGNTKYCPDSPVTRGQMAAFLDRALDLPATSTDFFVDDDDSIFEASINRFAAAGITKGCNPTEGNTKYCPSGTVSRAQMAAFLHRALG